MVRPNRYLGVNGDDDDDKDNNYDDDDGDDDDGNGGGGGDGQAQQVQMGISVDNISVQTYMGAWRSSFRNTKRKVSTKPYMDPQTNIMMRKSRISTFVRMVFRPPIASLDLGSSRSMSILKSCV